MKFNISWRHEFSTVALINIMPNLWRFTQLTASVEEKSVIIGERNSVAIEAVRRAIDSGHKRIAVLYGGGHMPDLGRRLREEFDLVPSQVQWITAWSIRNRELDIHSFPFLKTLAEISGWPLNRYQTLALFIFSSVLALDLWFWELFFGTVVNCASWAASEINLFRDAMSWSDGLLCILLYDVLLVMIL